MTSSEELIGRIDRGIIIFDGEIRWATMITLFQAFLSCNEDTIYVYFSSRGGSGHDAHYFIDWLQIMRKHYGFDKKIIAYSDSLGSAATMVATGFDEFYCQRMFSGMTHEPSIYEENEQLSRQLIRFYLTNLDDVAQILSKTYHQRSNGKLSLIEAEKMVIGEHHFNAKEYVNIGLADGIWEEQVEHIRTVMNRQNCSSIFSSYYNSIKDLKFYLEIFEIKNHISIHMFGLLESCDVERAYDNLVREMISDGQSEITVVFNLECGSLASAIGMINTIEMHKIAFPEIVFTAIVCGSIRGFNPLILLPFHHKYITPNSSVQFFLPEFRCTGTLNKVQYEKTMIDKHRESLEELIKKYVDSDKFTQTDIDNLYYNYRYLKPQEAIDCGFIDSFFE